METRTVAPPSPPLTVHPDELTALVERLQRSAPPDAMTTADVAATLGLSEAQVEAALRGLRAEAFPVVTDESRRLRKAERRRSRRRALRGALWLALAGGVIASAYGIGHSAGVSDGQRWSGYGRPEWAAQSLRTSLPVGTTMIIGDLTYRGQGSGRGMSGSGLTDEEIEMAIPDLVRKAQGPVVGGTIDVKAMRAALASENPKTVQGVEFVRAKVFNVAGETYATSIPVPSSDVYAASADLGAEIEAAARSRIAALANHAAQMAPLVPRGRPDATRPPARR